MDWNTAKALRIARAIISGDIDFDIPSRRTSNGILVFLAGLGTGVALGVLFAPTSGAEIRSNLSDRAREGLDAARSKTQEIGRRAQDVVNRGKERTNEAVNAAQQAYREETRSNVG